MKKIGLVLMLVAALVVGGVSGVTYAKKDSDDSMKGMKLVGSGVFGFSELPAPSVDYLQHGVTFAITNPDSVENITIERLCIFKGDGELLYQGPLEAVIAKEGDPNNTERIEVPWLPPHIQIHISLSNWMPDGEGGWLTWAEALLVPAYPYTVEVYYQTSGLDLIGSVWGWHYIVERGPWGAFDEYTVGRQAWSIPMVNMEQK